MSSLRTKLWLALGGLFLILSAGIALSAVVLGHFGVTLQQLLRENYDSVVFCEQMKDAADRLDAAARGAVWEGAGEQIDVGAEQMRFDENLRRQQANVSLPGEAALTQRLADLWAEYRAKYGLLSESGTNKRILYEGALRPGYHQLRETAQKVADLNTRNVVSADGRVRNRVTEVRRLLLALLAVAAVLAIAVLVVAGATVLQPLRSLIRSAREIEAGNLDLTVPVKSRDEVGQLAAAFNAMAAKLKEFRKIDLDRLTRARNTTQLAIDSLPDAVLVVGPGGQIEISNRAARDHFGIEPGSAVSGLGLAWLTELVERVGATHGPVEPRGFASAIQIFDDGREQFLLPHAVPMRDADGTIAGVAVIVADVTRLRQADEFKSGLVSTVSHELRTPLTSIRMSALLLADEKLGPLTPGQRKLVEAARGESERLYRIIEDLLNFSRAEAAGRRLQLRRMPARLIVSEALEPLRGAFWEKRIRVEIDMADAPDVQADPSCAGSVMSNLLSNALKFTPAGGEVRIDAQGAGEWVSFGVSDRGPGIAPELAGRIFERYFRVPTADGPPGSGLGLAIARQVVEAHGGNIRYSPREGGGSVFRFTLPAAPAEIGAAAPIPSAARS
ncbi:MAG: multi-sensor signal transduction histidine kinase [Phycisphaerales bacterium]|nr:multi-sensor signal transduction histidine kinase [Phycisphaerales bacterium]